MDANTTFLRLATRMTLAATTPAMRSQEPPPLELRDAARQALQGGSHMALWTRSSLTIAKLLSVTLRRAEEQAAGATAPEELSKAQQATSAAGAVASTFNSYIHTQATWRAGNPLRFPPLSAPTARHVHALLHALLRSDTLKSVARLLAHWADVLSTAAATAATAASAGQQGGVPADGAGPGPSSSGSGGEGLGAGSIAPSAPQAEAAPGSQRLGVDVCELLESTSEAVRVLAVLAACVQRLTPRSCGGGGRKGPPGGGLLPGCAAQTQGGAAAGLGGGSECGMQRELLAAVEDSRLLDHAARLLVLALSPGLAPPSVSPAVDRFTTELILALRRLLTLTFNARTSHQRLMAAIAAQSHLLFLVTGTALAQVVPEGGEGLGGLPQHLLPALRFVHFPEEEAAKIGAMDFPLPGALTYVVVMYRAQQPLGDMPPETRSLGDLIRWWAPEVLIRVVEEMTAQARRDAGVLGALRDMRRSQARLAQAMHEGKVLTYLVHAYQALEAARRWSYDQCPTADPQPADWWDVALEAAGMWPQLLGHEGESNAAAPSPAIDHMRVMQLRPLPSELEAEAAPPCVASALAAGYPARVERILRECYSGGGAAAVSVDPDGTVLALALDPGSLELLVRFGQPLQVASLLATVAKVLGCHAIRASYVSTLERKSMPLIRAAAVWLYGSSIQAASDEEDIGGEDSDEEGSDEEDSDEEDSDEADSDEEEQQSQRRPRAMADPERRALAAYAVLQLLPAMCWLERTRAEDSRYRRAGGIALTTSWAARSLAALLRGLGGGDGEGTPVRPPPPAAELATWERLMLVEADALGTLEKSIALLQLDRSQAGAGACTAVSEALELLCRCFPEGVAERLRAGGAGASGSRARSGSVAARLLAFVGAKGLCPDAGLEATLRRLSSGQAASQRARALEPAGPATGPDGGPGEGAGGPPPCGPLQAAYALMLTCGDLRCTNLEGDSEAELALGPAEGKGARGPLRYCARCGAGRARGARRGGRL
ncbi:hypothetical protein HYH03_004135 [Edaphochlamys debaryana]|uniref:Uncharacterized protein n=1 Tax=Edaphochlamys debaryana TaxID=47281 RepID=A0A835YHR6_9CHLO|nr:hypothetical protein HYH03_004135 [Edaphochlamys debaryana]|eukprot:KAG2497869.1 hypothetical protein HYH03_004135 [Edaphochlamys debaryana]